jgi:hypothetical protein
MDKFWAAYILVCIINIALDILAAIVLPKDIKLKIIFVAAAIILEFFIFPLLLITMKGEGMLLGIEATKENGRLVYYSTLLSFTILLVILWLSDHI